MNTLVAPIPKTHSVMYALRLFATESRYALLQVWRQPSFTIPTLLFPLAFYALFGLLLPSKTGNAAPAQYLLATYGAFGVIGPALFGFGVGMAMEREMGWLSLKRASPMPMSAYFFAKLVSSMAFGAAVVLALSALAASAGGVQLDAWRWPLLWVLLIVGSVPFCAMGLWIGSLVDAKASVAVVNLIYLPMSVFSGLWFPIGAFPEFLQKMALFLPAFHLGDLALTVVGVRQANVGLSLAVLMGYTVLFLALALMAQRRQSRSR